ncbi:MAG: TPM domain-containing protein, partial [Bacillota bacterium]|nr:TPM domain-containing protein [Bacillota bacterium]
MRKWKMIVLLVVMWCLMGTCTFAKQRYFNSATGCQVIIEDDADLLTDEEEEELAELMRGITDYGDVAFKTIDDNYQTTENYIKAYYQEQFGSGSGTIFLIDMDNRNIWIHSNGKIYRTITKSYANTITDNVYTYASRGDYYGCAREAFSEILTLLQGSKIAQPMKYISNALLALIVSLMLTFLVVAASSAVKKPKEKELLEATKYKYILKNPKATFTHTTKVYDPPSSGSSG